MKPGLTGSPWQLSHQTRSTTQPLPSLGSLKPTAIYNTYWRFAAERQAVFFRRFERRPPPWTHDAVLRDHKFTIVVG